MKATPLDEAACRALVASDRWNVATDPDTGCVVWLGYSQGGYGKVTLKPYDTGRLVHRVAWVAAHGNPDPSLVLDHLCRNRLCVNLDHLELTAQRTNILRGEGLAAVQAKQTHCKRGHLLAGDNLAPWKLAKGVRACLICSREHRNAS